MADCPVTHFCRPVDLEPSDSLWQQTHSLIFHTVAFHQWFAGQDLFISGCECPKALRDLKTAWQRVSGANKV